MKLQVIKPFNDKYTNQVYKEGDIIEKDTNRAKELLRYGAYIKAVEEEKAPVEKSTESTKPAKKSKKKEAKADD